MNRRDFLKLSGVASLALIAKLAPSAGKIPVFQPEGTVSGKLYRGVSGGKIYISEDQGKSWKLHTNFGDEVSILGFSERPGGLVAHLSYQSSPFDIRLAKNGKLWMTV